MTWSVTGAHLEVPVTDPGVVARLRDGGRPAHDVAVSEPEGAAVPGQVTQSWRICRRPAVRPCEFRWHRSPGRRHLGGKQDRHPRSVDLPGRAVGRIRHGAHLCPRVWSRGPGGVVDVDGLDEGEVSAEVTADKQGCASPGSTLCPARGGRGCEPPATPPAGPARWLVAACTSPRRVV